MVSLKWKWILSVTLHAGRIIGLFQVNVRSCLFLSCPDTRGVDGTHCLHLRCSPFSCLCTCIMKSLFTLWNLKPYKQSRPVSFLGTVSASWEAKQSMSYLFYNNLNSSALSYFISSFDWVSVSATRKRFFSYKQEDALILSRLLAHLGSC